MVDVDNYDKHQTENAPSLACLGVSSNRYGCYRAAIEHDEFVGTALVARLRETAIERQFDRVTALIALAQRCLEPPTRCLRRRLSRPPDRRRRRLRLSWRQIRPQAGTHRDPAADGTFDGGDRPPPLYDAIGIWAPILLLVLPALRRRRRVQRRGAVRARVLAEPARRLCELAGRRGRFRDADFGRAVHGLGLADTIPPEPHRPRRRRLHPPPHPGNARVHGRQAIQQTSGRIGFILACARITVYEQSLGER
jgi:hypothetical protein